MGMKAPVVSPNGVHDPAGRLIGLLESSGFDPRPTGHASWEAQCPAHKGSRHNLTVDVSDDGKVLVCCHHDPGCSTQAIVEAIGLTLGDLFPADGRRNGHAGSNGHARANGHAGGNGKPKKTKQKKVHPTIETAAERVAYGKKAVRTTTWPYLDLDRRSRMAIVRFDLPGGKKDYLPFHPVEGGWVAGDPEGKLPLFNLPDLADATRVYFHEGEKAAVLTQKLGLPSTTTAHGAKSPQRSDFPPLAGKEVVIFPDHDDEGEGYATKLLQLLGQLDPKPTVKIVRLPLEGGGDDVAEWLEDVRAKGWNDDACRAELERLADAAEAIDLSAMPPITEEKVEAKKGPKKKPQRRGDAGLYFEESGKLFVVGDEVPEVLANFTARVTHNVTRHEGGIQAVHYHISARHEKDEIGVREIKVPADKYASMTWVYSLGAEFTLSAGRDRRDHARCAVQLLSTNDGVQSSVEHTSLGWINHDDRWFYLHAGGAIGADGPSDAVRVDLAGDLAKYRLPDPPTDPEIIRKAVRATFETWNLAQGDTQGARGAAAIVSTLPWRAVIEPLNTTPHLGGSSGTRKTSTARLVLQFFSTEFRGKDAKAPASWEDTKAALQRMAYDCACSVLVIDDLKTQAQLEMAEEVVQNQGNLHSRQRMGVNRSLEPTLDPRGAILSTGEIDCKTVSSLGRLLGNPVRNGDIDLDVLTRLQALGDQGLFAISMSAYIRHLAPRLDDAREAMRKEKVDARNKLGDIPGAHPRHPEAIAELIAGYKLFLDYAVEIEAIEPLAADGYEEKARRYLIELAEGQSDTQADAKPGQKFLGLLRSALRMGQCRLADTTSGFAPTKFPGASGWQKDWLYQGRDVGQTPDWKIPANNKLIGFIDEHEGWIYLDDKASTAVANEQARRLTDSQSFANIGRELMNEGLCKVHIEGNKRRAAGQKRIRNHGKDRFFWISIATMFGESDEAKGTDDAF